MEGADSELGKDDDDKPCDPADTGDAGLVLVVSEGGVSLEALSLAEALRLSARSGSSEVWKKLVQDIASLCSWSARETPDKDVEVLGPDDEGVCATLVWRKSKTILLDEEAAADFEEAFGESWRNASGRSIFSVGSCTATDVVGKLSEGA